jgi:hypothetical protein
MPKDLEQSRRMLKMRIKVDVWSQGLDESFRESIRDNVRDLFCQLPVRRVWHYLKSFQYMLLQGHRIGELAYSGLDDGKSLDGPENVIAKGRTLYPSLKRISMVNLSLLSKSSDSQRRYRSPHVVYYYESHSIRRKTIP